MPSREYRISLSEHSLADDSKRKLTVWVLGGGMLLLFLLLGALNAFNFRFLHPRSIGQIFLFTSLSVLVFLLFVVVLILLSRNILKLFADQRVFLKQFWKQYRTTGAIWPSGRSLSRE